MFSGHYVPQLAQLIVQTKSKFNLKGIAVSTHTWNIFNNYNYRIRLCKTMYVRSSTYTSDWRHVLYLICADVWHWHMWLHSITFIFSNYHWCRRVNIVSSVGVCQCFNRRNILVNMNNTNLFVPMLLFSDRESSSWI
jgi:hypothetical protein